MNKTLLIIASVLLLCSCEPSSVRQGRKAYKAYLNKTLKDPASLKIYKEEHRETSKGIEWTLDYGAKNSYGGMDRKTAHFTTIGSSVITDTGIYDTK